MGHWALATRSKYSSRNVRHKQPIRHPLLEVLAMRTFGAAVIEDVAAGCSGRKLQSCYRAHLLKLTGIIFVGLDIAPACSPSPTR
jgi:hypothetical protein